MTDTPSLVAQRDAARNEVRLRMDARLAANEACEDDLDALLLLERRVALAEVLGEMEKTLPLTQQQLAAARGDLRAWLLDQLGGVE